MIATRTPAPLYAYDNGRAVGTFLNPNEFAAYLLVVLGLAAGIALYVRSTPLRLLAGTTLVAGLVRAGRDVLALGLSLGRRRARRSSRVAGRRPPHLGGLALVVLAGALLVLGPGQEHHNPRDDTSRVVAWTTGVRTWLAFPLTGVGPFAFRRTYDVLRPPEAPGGEAPVAFDPHSLPLAYLDESGLVGLARAAVVLVGLHSRDPARAARGRSAPAGARLRVGRGPRGPQRARAGQHDQHLLRAGDARRGVGARARAAGSRCARGLNSRWSRCWPALRAPARAGARSRGRAVPTPTPLPLHVTSSGGNGQFTTLSEMKHQRTIYIVRATSFVADTAASRTATGSGTFVDPHITFVDRSGARTVADAPKAVLTSADKSVLMTGGVHARSQDGNVLSCDRLRYDGNYGTDSRRRRRPHDDAVRASCWSATKSTATPAWPTSGSIASERAPR